MIDDSLYLIGNRLRVARGLRRASQDDIAKVGGPSRPTISRIERGEQVESLDAQLQRVALALNVNIAWLKTGEGQALLPPHPSNDTDVELNQLDEKLVKDMSEAARRGAARWAEIPPEELSAAKKLAAEALFYELGEMTDEEVLVFMRFWRKAKEEARRARELARKAEGEK